MSDAQRLRDDFCRELKSVVKESLATDLAGEFGESLQQEWYSGVQQKLDDVGDKLFERWDDHKSPLGEVGLGGRDLDAKLARFLQARKKWGEKQEKRTLLAALKWALIILGSLVEAILDEKLRWLIDAVKEFVESLTLAVEQS